jgi:hypothetical protein
MRSSSILLSGACAAWLLCPGCVENGLSIREKPGTDFSRYALSLYQDQALIADAAAPKQPLVLPARIAVAQIGEVAPPQAMLQVLRSDSDAFVAVQSIPAAAGTDARMIVNASGQREVDDSAARQRMNLMLRYTRDTGSDYLFLFGGTIDHATTGTGLSLADVTIVGAFMVPSKRISAEGRASGVLIDARSGHIVLAVGASRTDSLLAPTAAQDSDELKLLTSVRDELTKELAGQLKARAKEVAAGKKVT